MVILEAFELSKEFVKKNNKILAVSKASLQVKQGELTSIIGHSGSGKSTLFHLITGMLKPTSGFVRIEGLCINEAGAKKLSKLRNEKLGYILQEQNLLKNFTVLENVCMPGFVGVYGTKKDIHARAEKILEKVGLLAVKASYPNEISGGEARRVSIARALMNDPAIILADEPTSNLDPENSEAVMKLFRSISESGVAVLISTHDMKFLTYSDKVFIMNKGHLEEQVIIESVLHPQTCVTA